MTIPLAGLHREYLINTTLRQASPGEEQVVGFRKEPDIAIVNMLQESDLYATINCRKDQNGEIVKLMKGTYSSNGYRVKIVRGTSRFGDNSISQPLDLSNVRTDLFLDFYTISPKVFGEIYEFILSMTGQGGDFINKLPKATKDQAGLIKSAIDSNNFNQHSFAITTDSPLWKNLVQSIYGYNTESYINQDPNLKEMARSGYLRQLIDLFNENPSHFERLLRLSKELNNKKIDKLIKMLS